MKQINNNRTNVIATICQSSSGYDTLKEMIKNGVDVVRLNFSHGDYKDHKKTILNVRKISEELGLPVCILQDLQGPKIRVGKLNQDEIELSDGHQFYITSDNIVGNINEISIDNDVIDDIKENERILIDDGKIELKVIDKESKKIKVEVTRGGILLQRKGVNLPESDIKLSSVEDGVVNIEMLGACQGWPLSIATLKSGIERILMDKVPGVEQVIAT